jgi:hypothetical protein
LAANALTAAERYLKRYQRKQEREQARSEAAAAKYGTFSGVSMSPGEFYAQERRQRRERFRQRRRPARKPERRQSISARAPRTRRTRTAASRRGPPSSESDLPPLAHLRGFLPASIRMVQHLERRLGARRAALA